MAWRWGGPRSKLSHNNTFWVSHKAGAATALLHRDLSSADLDRGGRKEAGRMGQPLCPVSRVRDALGQSEGLTIYQSGPHQCQLLTLTGCLLKMWENFKAGGTRPLR
jgi:hypothetical protein